MEEEKAPMKVTDIDAVYENVMAAVDGFCQRWISMPGFGLDCEVMDAQQLRDAMGLRASMDWGDPWPTAEQELLRRKFRWHWLGSHRVMYLKERDGFAVDDGWDDGILVADGAPSACNGRKDGASMTNLKIHTDGDLQNWKQR